MNFLSERSEIFITHPYYCNKIDSKMTIQIYLELYEYISINSIFICQTLTGRNIMMYYGFDHMYTFWILGLLILFIIAIAVSNDATRHGRDGLLWGFIVVIMPMMGLLIYFVIRSTWITESRYNSNTSEIRTQTQPVVKSVPINNSNNQNGQFLNDTYYCTSCGEQNNAKASYCNSCGAQILVKS